MRTGVKQRLAAGAFIDWHVDGGRWADRGYGLAEIELGYRAAVTHDSLRRITIRGNAAVSGERSRY